MSVKVTASRTRIQEIKPGELFSLYGPEYWKDFAKTTKTAELVMLRTESSVHLGAYDQDVYRITISEE